MKRVTRRISHIQNANGYIAFRTDSLEPRSRSIHAEHCPSPVSTIDKVQRKNRMTETICGLHCPQLPVSQVVNVFVFVFLGLILNLPNANIVSESPSHSLCFDLLSNWFDNRFNYLGFDSIVQIRLEDTFVSLCIERVVSIIKY